MGLGKSLLARLRLDQDEVIEGWEFQVRKTQAEGIHGKTGYVAAIAQKEGRQVRAFASDETGLIHEGALTSDGLRHPLPDSIGDLAWGYVAPLGQRSGYSRFRGVLAELLLVQSATCGPNDGCFGCSPPTVSVFVQVARLGAPAVTGAGTPSAPITVVAPGVVTWAAPVAIGFVAFPVDALVGGAVVTCRRLPAGSSSHANVATRNFRRWSGRCRRGWRVCRG